MLESKVTFSALKICPKWVCTEILSEGAIKKDPKEIYFTKYTKRTQNKKIISQWRLLSTHTLVNLLWLLYFYIGNAVFILQTQTRVLSILLFWCPIVSLLCWSTCLWRVVQMLPENSRPVCVDEVWVALQGGGSPYWKEAYVGWPVVMVGLADWQDFEK